MIIKISNLFPLIGAILLLFISGIEAITYLGFIRVHTFIPTIIFYIIGIILLVYPIYLDSKVKKIADKILLVFAALISLSYFVLNMLESLNYQNFVFSTFHINMKGFEVFTFISLITYTFFSSRLVGIKKFTQVGLLTSLIFLFIFNISNLFPILVKSLIPMVSDPLASYDKKMTTAYPGFYPAMMMIASLTDKNTTIIIPPQSAPWVTEGNSFLVSRFLYPRHIVYKESEIKKSSPSSDVYMLIAKGSWPTDGTYTHGWPKTSIPATQLWKFDLKNNTYEIFSHDYDPTVDLWDWGLIKVKYE